MSTIRERVFHAIAMPFFLITITLLSFGEGGWRLVVKDWKEFFGDYL